MAAGLAALDQPDEYVRLFTDLPLWSPFVVEVCRRHNLNQPQPVRLGVPGTCPVFIAGERWVVKFFGRLFEGERAFAVEKEAGLLVRQDPIIGAAPFIASGELTSSGWHWPYLIFAYIPGDSIGLVIDQLSDAARAQMAREVGTRVRHLHDLPLPAVSPVFPDDALAYRQLLEAQRGVCVQNQRKWQVLPTHLIDQIDDFLPPLAALSDFARRPHLIHADLTGDHLLGRIQAGRWVTGGLIDFGDAMTGGLLYELAALHLDMFRGENALLRAFLDEYGLDGASRAELPVQAMAAALLHRFNVFSAVPPERLWASSLNELAACLWAA